MAGTAISWKRRAELANKRAASLRAEHVTGGAMKSATGGLWGGSAVLGFGYYRGRTGNKEWFGQDNRAVVSLAAGVAGLAMGSPKLVEAAKGPGYHYLGDYGESMGAKAATETTDG